MPLSAAQLAKLSTGFKQTMESAIKHADFTRHDSTIKTEVDGYNKTFATAKGWPASPGLDWLLIKALVLIESGGPSGKAWGGKTMQIGVSSDPGWQTVKSGGERTSRIMSAQLKAKFAAAKSPDTPVLNIQAGIVYLLNRMSSLLSVESPTGTAASYKVQPGDNFEKIARTQSTTIESLQARNPTVKPASLIAGKTVLTIFPAVYELEFKTFTFYNIAKSYNSMTTDPVYDIKLEFTYDLL